MSGQQYPRRIWSLNYHEHQDLGASKPELYVRRAPSGQRWVRKSNSHNENAHELKLPILKPDHRSDCNSFKRRDLPPIIPKTTKGVQRRKTRGSLGT